MASDRSVDPYEKPLSILDPEGSGKKQQRGPDSLALRRPPAVLHLARIVLLDRDKARPQPALEPLDLLDAMMAVIPQTSALTRLTDPLHELAGMIDACGGAYRLSYAEIAECAGLLQKLVASPPACTTSWGELATASAPPGLALWDGRWRQAAVDDAIRVGDEALLLVGGTPMRLGGIGMSIWEAVGEGLAWAGILDAVVGRHGAHPDAEVLVDEALDSLVSAGAVAYHRPMTLGQVMAGESADTVERLSGIGTGSR